MMSPIFTFFRDWWYIVIIYLVFSVVFHISSVYHHSKPTYRVNIVIDHDLSHIGFPLYHVSLKFILVGMASFNEFFFHLVLSRILPTRFYCLDF